MARCPTSFAATLMAIGLIARFARAQAPAEPVLRPSLQSARLPERPDDPPGYMRAPLVGRATSPPATVQRDGFVSVQVNTDQFGNNILGDAANEPSIAVDPTNTNNIVIGWRQFDSVFSNFRQAGWAYSHDGGQTWTFPGVIQPGIFRSDPVLGADADGNFFYSSLTLIGIFNQSFQVDMFKSTDAGVTWPTHVGAFGGDKQWITIDQTTGVGRGHLYQHWNRQFSCCGATDFTRAVDPGVMFEAPLALPPPFLRWGTLSVAPDGTLYIAGALATDLGTGGHVLARSSNARDPTQTPVFDLVQQVLLGGSTATGGVNPVGLLGQVWVATDHSAGASRGNVYILGSVTFAPFGSDPVDIRFIRSTDRGETWSSSVRVNDDPFTSNAWQWFGTMSVAPNGRIDVIWNDTRHDPTARLSELYYSFSIDTGITWRENLPLSPPFDPSLGYPNQNKLGDYYDMVSTNRRANLAYAATFNGEEDVYFLAIMPDCNENGVHDGTDILDGNSEDCNNNQIPDECETAPGLTIRFLNGIPHAVSDQGPVGVEVQVTATDETVVSGTAMLHYRYDGGAFQTAALSSSGPSLFHGDLPAANCGEMPEFFISAEGSQSGMATLPADAPVTVFTAPVGTLLPATFSDDFQTDQGWISGGILLTGGWERGVPVAGSRAGPPDDFDGSGQAFVTGNTVGNSGVAGGAAILVSPPFDAMECQRLFYAYWLNDTCALPLGPGDSLTVEIATDAQGTNWQVVRTYTIASPVWRTDSIEIGTEVPATPTMRVRFTAQDSLPGNVLEAGLDAVMVAATHCGQQPVCCTAGIFPDVDTDNVCDLVDNCPTIDNADQQDADQDGFGDACDECTDADGDGRGNGDNGNSGCPGGTAVDCDDTAGNASDADGDNVCDPADDCPATAAGDPVDSAGCSTADDDGDGVFNDQDACPETPPCVLSVDQSNGCPSDVDEDGVPDGCDNCLFAANPAQADGDGNGLGDACDSLLAFEDCPQAVTVRLSSAQQSVAVDFPIPAAVNGFGDVQVTADPPPGSQFSPGTTTVRVEATDQTGKMVTCTFDVLILRAGDDAPPPALPPSAMGDCGCGQGMGGMLLMPLLWLGWGLLRNRPRRRQ